MIHAVEHALRHERLHRRDDRARALECGGGAPTAKFPTIGTSVGGRITEKPFVQQQRDIDSGEPKFWNDGKPMMQLVVTVQTNQSDPSIQDDDGRRRLFVKGQLKQAVHDAVRAVGGSGLEVGGHLTVTYVADGEAKKRGFTPPKQYTAKYVPAAQVELNTPDPGVPAGVNPHTGEITTPAVPAQAAAPAGVPGLTPDQLAAANLGVVATQLRRPDHLVDVRVRARPSPGLQDALVGRDGVVFPAGATLRSESTCPSAVALRENGQNLVHLTARLSGLSLGEGAAAVQARLAGWTLPTGYSWKLGGLVEQQRASLRALAQVLAVAVLGVLVVLLLQLRSYRRALAVLAAVPLALAAAAYTLALSGVSLSVSSMMGAILLVGLVVKNGILLLDHALHDEAAGVAPREALLRAGVARLRPILMTTLATVAALLPLVLGLGAGSALHRPLALVVVLGLTLSTAATLFVVPVLALPPKT